MTRQQIREVLASGGLSLLFAPKDSDRRTQDQTQHPQHGRPTAERRGVEEPTAEPKARAAG